MYARKWSRWLVAMRGSFYFSHFSHTPEEKRALSQKSVSLSEENLIKTDAAIIQSNQRRFITIPLLFHENIRTDRISINAIRNEKISNSDISNILSRCLIFLNLRLESRKLINYRRRGYVPISIRQLTFSLSFDVTTRHRGYTNICTMQIPDRSDQSMPVPTTGHRKLDCPTGKSRIPIRWSVDLSRIDPSHFNEDIPL